MLMVKNVSEKVRRVYIWFMIITTITVTIFLVIFVTISDREWFMSDTGMVRDKIRETSVRNKLGMLLRVEIHYS